MYDVSIMNDGLSCREKLLNRRYLIAHKALKRSSLSRALERLSA